MAIGLALLLGFRFPQNFDRPYAARSLQDFWRRWHMTLSRWLRDYLYIPLGGSHGLGREDVPQPHAHDAARRAVARRELDLRRLGRDPRHRAGRRALVAAAQPGPPARSAGGRPAPRRRPSRGAGSSLAAAAPTRRGPRSAPRTPKDVHPGRPTDTTSRSRAGTVLAGSSVAVTFNVVCFAWVFFRSPDLEHGFRACSVADPDWGPSPLVTWAGRGGDRRGDVDAVPAVVGLARRCSSGFAAAYPGAGRPLRHLHRDHQHRRRRPGRRTVPVLPVLMGTAEVRVSIDVTPREETDEHFIDSVEHPAARSGQARAPCRRGGSSSLVVVALITATLLNSEGLVRAGEGMQTGLTRDDDARGRDAPSTGSPSRRARPERASTTRSPPRSGRRTSSRRGDPRRRPAGSIVGAAGSTPSSGRRQRRRARRRARRRQREVTLRTTAPEAAPAAGPGDRRLARDLRRPMQLDQPHRRRRPRRIVSLLDRNGTGLTNPSLLQLAEGRPHRHGQAAPRRGHHGHRRERRLAHEHPGRRPGPQVGSDAWVDEYARRAAAVMRTFLDGGAGGLLVRPPDRARQRLGHALPQDQPADRAAAAAVPGAQYVDLYRGTAVDGSYADYVVDGGQAGQGATARRRALELRRGPPAGAAHPRASSRPIAGDLR